MKIVAENILFQYPVEYLDKSSLFSRKKLTGCGWSEVKIKKKNWNYRLLNKNCRKCDLRWRKQKSKWIRRNFASQLLYKNGWRLRINTKRNIFSIGNSWLWTKCKMQKKQWVLFCLLYWRLFFRCTWYPYKHAWDNFGNWNPFKNYGKCLLFHLESSFRS